ncbi:RIP metalloprotease RseP [Propionivibrio soli]|uniref:RIP metalloprotease RseP n=1 Tax=Propionivibrio soli TaxID=2976531 RepID=UPI0021E7DB68|nr:RIP metalloprotease RseP [Propionivibrio soli]
MSFLHYLIAFAVLIGVLVVVHELGHYTVARLVGVKVLRFSVGFGRPVWSRSFGRDRTEWAIGLFPLGGYVKMLDEREERVPIAELPRAFNRQSVWRRAAIVIAGPGANLLLAVLLYWALFWNGMEELRPIVGKPLDSTPAAIAGFKDGERVLKVDGEPVLTWQDVRWALVNLAAEKQTVDLEVINPRDEIAVRHLSVVGVREAGWEGDALQQLGLRIFRPRVPPVIGKLIPDSPAERAGLLPGDEIVAIEGQPVDSWQEVVQAVMEAPSRRLGMEIDRGGQDVRIDIVPNASSERGRQVGRIGAYVRDAGVNRDELLVTVRYGLLPAFGKALDETWDKAVFSLVMMGKMVLGEVSWRNISGPVTIADYAGQSASLGLDYYLKFMALVSISLAVLNLLPIPILDGGHLLYYVLEIIKRGPLSERTMEIGQQIGLALMLLLMAFAFYNDLDRLISS